MRSTAHEFPSNARRALRDAELRRALSLARGGFVDKRRAAVDALPEFEALRTSAKQIKEHTLAHLDFYLERYEQKVLESGGVVHWAASAEEARDIALRICAEAGATKILKGKTMVGEEVAINDALAKAGHEVIETDLGEYIIQLAEEPPSHIIAPAVHKTRQQIVDLFGKHHSAADHTEPLEEIPAIVNEARQVLRRAFLSGEVGITGANFLLAESGSSVIVTNEGNGDLSCTLPRVHIVTAGIEKVLPTFEDMCVLLRLLGRSATGQEMSSYTTLSTGPKREGDLDGPEQYHVILVDNGRSHMLGGRVQGDAALHSLRRVPKPLPGLRRCGRAQLRLGLPGPDGLGADAAHRRAGQGVSLTQCLHAQRALSGSVPDEHPAPQDVAQAAYARVRSPFDTGAHALRHTRLGMARNTPAALRLGDGDGRARAGLAWTKTWAFSLVAFRGRLDIGS